MTRCIDSTEGLPMSPLWQRRLVWLAFSGLLLLGLVIYKDYGYSWDEEISRQQNGLANYVFLTHGDHSLLCQSGEKHHGPAFEIALFFLEKGLRLEDTRSIYFMRHCVTFLLFFAAAVVFYRLLRQRFASRLVGLAGAAFLVLSPRIFADAFYNSKDAAFLSLYVFSLATLTRFLKKPATHTAAWHALSCGFLIDVRILGLVVPFLTLTLLPATWYARSRRGEAVIPPWRSLGWFAGLTAVFVVLFWPNLWTNPPGNFLEAFNQMRRYPWTGAVFYRGEEIPATQLPWHYVPCWIVITTPVLYSLFFAVGLGRFLVDACRRPIDFLIHRTPDLAWAAAFFLPVLSVIGLHSTIYDGWRHLYFVYPAFLFLAVLGATTLYAGARLLSRRTRAAVPVFLVLCALPVAATGWEMVRTHPYQNVWFNSLAGPDMQTIKSRYEMDYWGLSCRAGLEKLLDLDRSEVVTIYAETTPVSDSAVMLTPEQRARIRFTQNLAEADYYLSHYREHRSEFPADRDVCIVSVGNAKLFVAQKLR
jgi:hypothetical protein